MSSSESDSGDENEEVEEVLEDELYDHDWQDENPSVFSRLAIFGDSSWSLLTSFSMMFIAIAIVYVLDESPLQEQASFPPLGPLPKIDPPHIFTLSVQVDDEATPSTEIRRAYDRDGVVCVRGLLSEDQLQRLDTASSILIQEQQEQDSRRPRKRTGTQFHTVRQGTVFRAHDSVRDQDTPVAATFQEIALHSAVPHFAAALLQLPSDASNSNMRLMRDIFLAKDEEQYVCGWHVDDTGFWPATAEASGVNAWIAIDDMPRRRGGGFALAVGSHVAPWHDEAHHVTGSTMTFPKDGFRDAADMAANRTGSGTCNIRTAAPHIHKRMEQTKRIYNVKRGDVIFHTRWLFHRTVPFDRNARSNDTNDEIYRRYSVRYGPGSSRIPPGYGLEPSVLWNEQNAGRTADEVALQDGPWYPQCWPSTDEKELEQIGVLIDERLPVAEERRKERRHDIQKYLDKVGKGRHKSQH